RALCQSTLEGCPFRLLQKNSLSIACCLVLGSKVQLLTIREILEEKREFQTPTELGSRSRQGNIISARSFNASLGHSALRPRSPAAPLYWHKGMLGSSRVLFVAAITKFSAGVSVSTYV